jgi:hypothetical protein
MLFSVGGAAALLEGGAVVAVVVGVLEVLDGASLPLFPQAAVNEPSPINAAPPTTATTR